MELEEPEGDMELEEPDGDIEPVDELEGEVTLGEVEAGFFILELEGLEHAPKAKADAIAKGSASDFSFIER